MPTLHALHDPPGRIVRAANRTRLIRIARRHGPLIIDDASYAYLVEDPPPPLAATAPGVIVYVSGLSENLATGLRVGFVLAPPSAVPSLERAFRATIRNTRALTTRGTLAGRGPATADCGGGSAHRVRRRSGRAVEPRCCGLVEELTEDECGQGTEGGVGLGWHVQSMSAKK
ncbi:hypothetical protein GCM10023257_11330 [Streptomyces hyderabadensis]|uniref:Aminotransferase class I/classII domain-containing protein n=1 Tax=Streptomyces hyderabadensis TaxID=598549 RepID=A0ABP9HQ92_9ACTN